MAKRYISPINLSRIPCHQFFSFKFYCYAIFPFSDYCLIPQTVFFLPYSSFIKQPIYLVHSDEHFVPPYKRY